MAGPNSNSRTPYGDLPAPPGQNIVQTALAAGRDIARVDVIENPISDGVPFVKLRSGNGDERLEFLTTRLEKPHRTAGVYVLNDVRSFLEYWKRYATKQSVCYASIDPAQFVAVIDHHALNPVVGGETTAPADFEEHRAVYSLAFSKEWTTWKEKNGVKFDGNEAFAEWLENQVPDVVSPPGAEMLSIALNFRATNNVVFSNDVNLTNGKAEFTFNRQVEGSANVSSGKIAIPETFTIEIPVFSGIDAPKYRMDVRFRYRLGTQRLSIWIELVRPHKVMEAAFKDELAAVQEAIAGAVLFGKPAAAH